MIFFSATATDTLTSITPNSVDLANNVAGAGGLGYGNTGANLGAGVAEASAVVTRKNAPGATARYTLYVNNTAGAADVFGLLASTNSAFGTVGLPLGWSVVFRDGNEAVVTSTGVIPANGNKLVYADVTIPSTQAPGSFDVYFQALSPTTGIYDRVHNALSVMSVRQLSVTPNHSGQVFAGSSVVYTHTIANHGTVTEGIGPNRINLRTARPPLKSLCASPTTRASK